MFLLPMSLRGERNIPMGSGQNDEKSPARCTSQDARTELRCFDDFWGTKLGDVANQKGFFGMKSNRDS